MFLDRLIAAATKRQIKDAKRNAGGTGTRHSDS
jgi:hypothetical protein